jgi:hypothetical protein
VTAPDRVVVWLREAMDAEAALAERAAARHTVWPLAGARRRYEAAATGQFDDPDLYAGLTLIEAYSPQRVLRRIAAARQLLDDLLAEKHEVVEGDCWYTCAAATEEHDGGETCDDDRRGTPCDCGRDARVQRRVRLLAEGWEWTEETAASN